MKKFLVAIGLVISSQQAFANEPIEFLKKMIQQNPDHTFYNGVEYAQLGTFINTPSLSIEKKGNNPAGFLTNTIGQFLHIYALANKKLAFDNYTLTFSFMTPNGAEHSFNCHAIDNYNCGKIELINCSQSKFGYGFKKGNQVFTYNHTKAELCEKDDSKINNQNRSSSGKIGTETNSSRSTAIGNTSK